MKWVPLLVPSGTGISADFVVAFAVIIVFLTQDKLQIIPSLETFAGALLAGI